MPPQKTRKRPFGLIAIIILQLISVLVAAIGMYLANDGTIDVIWVKTIHTGGIPTFNIVAIIMGLVISFGLWQLKRWAWFLVMVQLGLSMAGGLWFYTQGTPQYFDMIVDVIAVFYLNQRDVQKAFEQQEKPYETTL